MNGAGMRHKRYGKYRGIAQNIDDPENLGRIMAKVPEVYGEMDSPWAMPCISFADIIQGSLTLPKIGDGVWIEFEAGDIDLPIWTGCWLIQKVLQNEIPEPRPAEIEVLSTLKGCRITSYGLSE
jgi:hypothetical protein